MAHTSRGTVGYREMGSGSPLVLIMGFSGSMDYWAPSLVDALAAHHTVIVFDNAGVGRAAARTPPLTITAMAQQRPSLSRSTGSSDRATGHRPRRPRAGAPGQTSAGNNVKAPPWIGRTARKQR